MSAVAASPAAGALHASAVVVGEAGVLLRGPAGAGKTSLALALVEAARARGLYARLVADDRVRLSDGGERPVLRAHPLIEGLVERRGQGIGPVEHERAAVLRCVVDILPACDNPSRMPEPDEMTARIGRFALPRLALGGKAGARDNADRVLAFMAGGGFLYG